MFMLNSSVVGHNIYMSALVSKHFFMILVTKLMCVSAYPLLSWLYEDDTVLCVLSLLQSSQTSLKYILYPHPKLLYSAACSLKRKSCMLLLAYLCWISPLLLWWKTCCGNLQCKIMIFINCNAVSSNRFLRLPRYLMRQYFLLGSWSLKVKKYGAVLILLSMLAFMLVQYSASRASILVFSMPIWLICSCFNAPSCSNVGIIIFLPLLATPFRIAISSLHAFFLGITQI